MKFGQVRDDRIVAIKEQTCQFLPHNHIIHLLLDCCVYSDSSGQCLSIRVQWTPFKKKKMFRFGLFRFS